MLSTASHVLALAWWHSSAITQPNCSHHFVGLSKYFRYSVWTVAMVMCPILHSLPRITPTCPVNSGIFVSTYWIHCWRMSSVCTITSVRVWQSDANASPIKDFPVPGGRMIIPCSFSIIALTASDLTLEALVLFRVVERGHEFQNGLLRARAVVVVADRVREQAPGSAWKEVLALGQHATVINYSVAIARLDKGQLVLQLLPLRGSKLGNIDRDQVGDFQSS